MAKAKDKEDLAAELAAAYGQWEHLREHGGSDPFYADGTNMNLIRNHIVYYKNKIREEYGGDYGKYPEAFYRELPPQTDEAYMARAGEIREGAKQALNAYISDPNFFYLLANKDMLTEKEAKQANIDNALKSVSGLASAIRDGDLIAMRRHAGRPEGYLESLAQCATKVMGLIKGREQGPEQMQGSGQLSLFQFGLENGRGR